MVKSIGPHATNTKLWDGIFLKDDTVIDEDERLLSRETNMREFVVHQSYCTHILLVIQARYYALLSGAMPTYAKQVMVSHNMSLTGVHLNTPVGDCPVKLKEQARSTLHVPFSRIQLLCFFSSRQRRQSLHWMGCQETTGRELIIFYLSLVQSIFFLVRCIGILPISFGLNTVLFLRCNKACIGGGARRTTSMEQP